VEISLSVIVPMLNEERSIAATLHSIREGAPEAEVIVVDGNSMDRSRALAEPLCDVLVTGKRGRARQLNEGASRARGEVLAFVHADTLVPASFASDIASALADPSVVGGRFDVVLDDSAFIFRLIGLLISLRSRLSRTGTGDQAMFVRRKAFSELGGFPDIELCEDLEFARRLKRVGGVACLRARVTTSARRWRVEGIFRTVFRMWVIRLLYLIGVSPRRLKTFYVDSR